MNNFYVYILFSVAFSRYYVGQTSNIETRLQFHNNGLVRSTKAFMPWKIVWLAKKSSRSEAMILERKIKNLGSQRIQQFIEKYSDGKQM